MFRGVLYSREVEQPLPISTEEALNLFKLLHPLMHGKPTEDDVFTGDLPDEIFESEKQLYLMITGRLALEASIGRITASEIEPS